VPDEAIADAWGIDFSAALAVITGDVAMGANPAQALGGVRLLTLVNEVSLRHLMAAEIAQGSGVVQGRPGAAFGAVAVTPDELGVGGESAWRDGRVHLGVHTTVNGRSVGIIDAGSDMTFGFGDLLAHLCRTRRVRAGSVVSSGTVRHRDARQGWGCIADKRASEHEQNGECTTPYLALGDSVTIEVKGKNGVSVFGAIAQTVALAATARR
jgi:fumarylacetoacetate (FAA) hydrolase